MRRFIGADSLEELKNIIDRLPRKALALKPALPPAFDTKAHEYAGFIIREWKHTSFEDGRITIRYDTAYEIPE